MSYDRTIIQGNLGTDVELRDTGSGKAVANFRVAVEYPTGGGDGRATEWYSVVCWERAATIASEYLKKGNQVLLEGSMRTRSWTDDDGHKHYRTELHIQGPSGLRLLGQRDDKKEPRQRGSREEGRQRNERAPRQRDNPPAPEDAPLPQVPAAATAKEQEPPPQAPPADPSPPAAVPPSDDDPTDVKF